MAEDVKKLLLQIDASVELLKRNLNQGDDRIERFERDTKRRLQSVDRSFDRLGRGVDVLKNRFNGLRGTLAAIGVAFGVAQISSFIRSSFELASSLGETAQQLGVTTRALQVYRFLGGQVGISNETMDRSLGKFNRTLGEAALGSAPRATRALQAFGFSLAEIRRGLTVETALPRIADGLSRVESSSRRAAVEALFFGRAGQQLDTLLSQGGARINELAEAAERLGYVLSDEQIARLDDAADKYEALKTLLSAQIAGVVADNVDAIMSLINALGELIRLAGLAGNAWRSFRLELEAQRLEASLSDAASTPPEWGLGGRGHGLEPRERLQRLERLSEIRGEQLDLARRSDPNYRPPAPPPRPRQAPRPPAEPDLDSIERRTTTTTPPRTNQQAFNDFRAAFTALGGRQAAGRTGFRTTRDQQQIHAAGESPLDGVRRVSRHQTWQAFDPTRASHDEERARAAAAQAGLRGFRVVNESGGRRHYEWSGHGQRGDLELAIEEQERQEEEARRQREQELRAEFQFDSEMRRARVNTLQAQRDLATDGGERVELSTRIMDIEREQEFAALDLSVTLGERTTAQADALKAEYDVADRLRFQALQVEEQNRRREAVEQLLAQRAEIARSLLEGEANLATTARERRRIELRILDLAYQEERARLQRIIRESRDADERQRAQERLDSLPEQHRQQQERTRQDTRGPLEEWIANVPRTAAEMDEALQRVAANGLQALNDGLVDAIMGAKSLGEVFKSVANQIIADLLRIAIQKAITAGLNAIMGGSGGDSGDGGLGFLGNLFGGGGKKPFGKAIGGGVSPNRIYEVGERGRELFVPSVAGNIIPNHAIGGSGVAVNMNWTLNAPGADPAALGRLQQSVERFSSQFEARVVGVVQDAIDRRMIR